ncbi:MAG: hypothetical protein V3S89_11295 [Desulfobacterales bacterium]
MRPPRALHPGFSLGHPLGFPNRPHLQIKVLRLLLNYLVTIDTPGTLIERDISIEADNGLSYEQD